MWGFLNLFFYDSDSLWIFVGLVILPVPLGIALGHLYARWKWHRQDRLQQARATTATGAKQEQTS